MATDPLVLLLLGLAVPLASFVFEVGWLALYQGVAAAKTVGKLIAERAKAAGVGAVRFDRGGYKYHGRIKHLADAARTRDASTVENYRQ